MFANHHRHEEFAVGDRVLLDASNLSILGIHKLSKWLVGPFVVKVCIGEVAYRLDLKGQFTHVHPAFHVSLLRRFIAGGDGIEPPEPIEVKDT